MAVQYGVRTYGLVVKGLVSSMSSRSAEGNFSQQGIA